MKRPTVPLARNRTSNRCNYASRGNAKKDFDGAVENAVVPTLQESDVRNRGGDIGTTRYNAVVGYQIRQFRKADFDTLWRIDQACFDPQLAYSRPELAFYMQRPGSFTLVAESAKDEPSSKSRARSANFPVGILGFVVAENRRKSGHIITIDVIAEARRSGVGSGLLQAAEEKLAHAGTATVALETPVSNLPAIRFYKREGYFVEKTVAGYYSGLLDAVVMTKELKQVPVPKADD
jgi:ribosomal-protein-alanine N-acetyltransferase